MLSLLTAAAAASVLVRTECSWDRPGHNAFTGDVVAAVDRYTDIPRPVREALKSRMRARKYDDFAVITRDRVQGVHAYDGLRDMHFGSGTVCRTVTRSKWKDSAVERGLVYCEDRHCLIVPTVCRNVSRVTRVPPPPPPEDPLAQFIPGGHELEEAPSTSFEEVTGQRARTLSLPDVQPSGSTGAAPGPAGGVPSFSSASFGSLSEAPTAMRVLPALPGMDADAAAVAAIPEPSIYLQLGVGLLMIGAVVGRRMTLWRRFRFN